MQKNISFIVAALCVLAAVLLQPAHADLPIHCLHAQVAGDWEFTLDAGGHKVGPNGDLTAITCGYPQPDRNADHFTRPPVLVAASTYKVTLASPNTATDAAGNKGTWTMIYDEGFEVQIGGRSFFAFSKYVPNPGTPLSSDKVAHYTSHCDETMVGWWHDKTANTWGCYRGKQTKAANSWTTAVSKVKDDGIDHVPVVSPTSFLEEFTRILPRDTDADMMAELRAERRALRASQAEDVALLETGEALDSYADTDLQGAFDPSATDSGIPHPHSHVAAELPELDDNMLFEPDFSFIERHNSNKRNTWKAGSYKEFEKKPVKDMLRMLGMRRFARDNTGPKREKLLQPIQDSRPDHIKYAGLPTNWDWSDRNGVNYDTEVRNQGSCGSCYAMAAVTAFEGRFRVKSRLAFRPIISPQDFVSCSFYNQGCEGGFPYLVAKHGAEFGMVDAECHPYTARNSECHTKCTSERMFLTNYSYVGGFMGGCSEVAMMREIYENGPIMVAFQAPPDLFYYTGGIYTGPSPRSEPQGVNGVNVWQQTNHAVVAVGWGVDPKTGVKYWKLKNTWGLRWGENGYFRIRRGTNECGVESMASKADVVLPKSLQIPADAPDPWAPEKPDTKAASKYRFKQRRKATRKVNRTPVYYNE